MTRAELNAQAREAGVPHPEKLPNKAAVEAAISEPDLTVAAAVERDLADLGKRAPGLERSALAASARTLARAMDGPKTSATAKSMCAARLLETLDRLRGLAPAEKERDSLDDLATRRAARLEGRAVASH